MSAYTDFVRQHIHKAKGATFKDKMRSVAAAWRAQKGRGAGLMAPSGRGSMRGGDLRDDIVKQLKESPRKYTVKGAGIMDVLSDIWKGIKIAAHEAAAIAPDVVKLVQAYKAAKGGRVPKAALRRLLAAHRAKHGGSGKETKEPAWMKKLREGVANGTVKTPAIDDPSNPFFNPKFKKGKGVMSIMPAREGASGGRVKHSQGALAAMIHGLGLRA